MEGGTLGWGATRVLPHIRHAIFGSFGTISFGEPPPGLPSLVSSRTDVEPKIYDCRPKSRHIVPKPLHDRNVSQQIDNVCMMKNRGDDELGIHYRAPCVLLVREKRVVFASVAENLCQISVCLLELSGSRLLLRGSQRSKAHFDKVRALFFPMCPLRSPPDNGLREAS